MPKLISTSEHATLTAVVAAVNAALPEGSDIAALLADEGALIAALTPAPAAAEISEEQGAQFVNDFFASCGIEIAADSNAEDTLAALQGAQESFGIVASALTEQGVDLESIIAAEDPSTALKEAVTGLASKKAVAVVAAAGATAEDLPAVPVGDEATAGDVLARYEAMEPGTDERLAYFKANKTTILSAQRAAL